MSNVVKNKVVLITGGSSGIGFACAKELLRHGAKGITITGTTQIKGDNAIRAIENEFGSNRAIFVKSDVTKKSELENAFKATINKWTSIDIVINNAGLMKDNQWEREIAINCNGVVQSTLFALKYMRKDQGGKGGVIVNVSSLAGVAVLDCIPLYVATKHFVTAFTRALGTEYHYNHTGVKVLLLCPSATDTTLLSESARDALKELAPDIVEYAQQQVGEFAVQSVEYVAQGLITILAEGENGSCWMSEVSKPIYEFEVPFVQPKHKY